MFFLVCCFLLRAMLRCGSVAHVILFSFQGKQYYPCPIKEGTRPQRRQVTCRVPTVCNCKAWDLHWGLLALKACPSLHFSGLTASGVLCLTTQCLSAVLLFLLLKHLLFWLSLVNMKHLTSFC